SALYGGRQRHVPVRMNQRVDGVVRVVRVRAESNFEQAVRCAAEKLHDEWRLDLGVTLRIADADANGDLHAVAERFRGATERTPHDRAPFAPVVEANAPFAHF